MRHVGTRRTGLPTDPCFEREHNLHVLLPILTVFVGISLVEFQSDMS